jgi:ubiquinone/menaquinone biosynthesis C-methylase UbiE
VDKNPAFETLLRDNLKQYTSLQLERIVHCPAEDMHEVPDESVDAVVASLVLCSVSDVPRVLAEVRRVLAPVRNTTEYY